MERSSVNIHENIQKNSLNTVFKDNKALNKSFFNKLRVALMQKRQFIDLLRKQLGVYSYQNTSVSTTISFHIFSEGVISTLLFFRLSALTQATVLSELTAIDRKENRYRFGLRYVLLSPAYNERYIVETTIPNMDMLSL